MASSSQYTYDVALSFAGEDRRYAEALANELKSRGVRVFYDRYERPALWGKNLYTHLSDLYENQAEYCVMFLSRYYAAKVWTNHEREAAQARAVRESREYILPIRLDETHIPGILPTISYISLEEVTIESIADAILQKLSKKSNFLPSSNPTAWKKKRLLQESFPPHIFRSVEQLWYTWTPTGFAGYRGIQVRAASQGLMDVQSPFMRNLNRYLGYALPEGTDLAALKPAIAPISLALFYSENGKVLVNKQYIGTDGVGRPGNFFTHLLAGFPKGFSAREAINTWRSPFWCNSDITLPRGNLELPPVSMDDLKFGSLTLRDVIKVKEYLPFVIQAFLSLKEQQQIYIAAPPELVAILVWGLTRSVPNGLLSRFTFSTYEGDVEKADALIVGTSWILRPTSRVPDLPSYCYEKGLAINCFSEGSRKRSKLDDNAIAAAFADFATECLASGNMDELAELICDAEDSGIDDANAFLSLFKVRLHSPSLAENVQLETHLATKISASISLLRNKIQTDIIQSAIDNPSRWEQQIKPSLQRLLSQSYDEPTGDLATALYMLAREAAFEARIAIDNNNITDFVKLLDLIRNSTSPSSNIWFDLLLLLSEEPIYSNIKNNWQIYSSILGTWSISLASHSQTEYLNLIRPWLTVQGKEVYRLLSLSLPEYWNEIALAETLHVPLEELPMGFISAIKDNANLLDELEIDPKSLVRLIGAKLLWVDAKPTRDTDERRTLESLGAQIITSTSVTETKEYLRSSNFSLIISNWKLAREKHSSLAFWKCLCRRQDGLTLLEELQRMNITMPFIIYTSSAPKKRIDKALERGVFGCTDNPKDLIRLIIKCLVNSH